MKGFSGSQSCWNHANSTRTGNAETARVFGGHFRKAYQAQLLTGNGVGIEVFQIVDPVPEPAEADRAEPVPYRRNGLWHICLTHPDVSAMLDRVGPRDRSFRKVIGGGEAHIGARDANLRHGACSG